MGRIAFLMDSEYEDVEFQQPCNALRAAGHECRVVGLAAGTLLSGKRGGSQACVRDALSTADPESFDALVIPGGQSPDRLKACDASRTFVAHFVRRTAPIGAICTGPQLLIDAGGVRGRTLTSWIALRPRLCEAGASWVDQEVVEDRNLVTARKPSDLPKFVRALERRLAMLGAGLAASR